MDTRPHWDTRLRRAGRDAIGRLRVTRDAEVEREAAAVSPSVVGQTRVWVRSARVHASTGRHLGGGLTFERHLAEADRIPPGPRRKRLAGGRAIDAQPQRSRWRVVEAPPCPRGTSRP